MPNPSQPAFSEWENLQSLLRTTYNRLVIKDFRDDIDISGSPLDFTTNEQRLMYACQVQDNDTAPMACIRMLFYFMIRNEASLQPVYGVPSQFFTENSIKFTPHIRLFFSELPELVREGYSPIKSEVTFAITNETSASLTESKVYNFALRVKQQFANGDKPHIYQRGNKHYTYRDRDNGFNFKILSNSEVEARELMQKCMSVVNKQPDWDRLTVHDPKRKSTNTSTTRRILGKRVRNPRYRPVTRLRFRYAELFISGLPQPITLLDYTNKRFAVLV